MIKKSLAICGVISIVATGCNSGSTSSPEILNDNAATDSTNEAVTTPESEVEVSEPSTEQQGDEVESEIEPDNSVANSGFTLDGMPFPEASPFAEQEIKPLLNFLFSNYRANRVVDFFNTIDFVEMRVQSENNEFTSLNLEESQFTRIHLCPQGGRYLAGSSAQSGYKDDYFLDDCKIDGMTISGSYSFIAPEAPGTHTDSIGTTYNTWGLTVLHSDGVRQNFVGNYTEADYSRDGLHPSVHIGPNVGRSVALFKTTIESTELVEGYSHYSGTSNEGQGPDQNGEMFFQRILTNGENEFIVRENNGELNAPYITVGVTVPLVKRSRNENFTTGQIDFLINGDDSGSKLVVQLDNGDPNTFDVFVFESADSVNTLTVPWSDFDTLDVPRLRDYGRSATF